MSVEENIKKLQYKKHVELSPHRTAWVKFGNYRQAVFIGKDFICMGSGCHILIINLTTREEFLYTINTKTTGQGVQTYAGHKYLQVFAFAEKSRMPKIFVKTCPNFSTICTLNKSSSEDFISLAFSESDYLITLNDTPSFAIFIWNWRSGCRITSINSNFFSRDQKIRCNLSSPVHFAQVEVASTKLSLWDVAMCGKKCFLTPHIIVPLNDSGLFVDILWTTEGTLFVLDDLGHVYTVDLEYNLTRVIEWTGSGNNITSFAWCKGGIVISGPNSEVKHFKKSGQWICDWTTTPPKPISKITSNYRELLVGADEKGDVLLYDSAKEEFEYIRRHQNEFNDVCLIYPAGQYFVTLQDKHILASWELNTGQMMDMKTLKYQTLAIKENPEYPYVGAAYENGVLELFSLFNPNCITAMTSFNLSREPLNSIYFSEVGKVIVAANTNTGTFFIIEGIPGSQMQILATVNADQQICDYILIASRSCMRLFAILVTSEIYLAGDKIVRYCIIRNKSDIDKKEYKLENPFQMYSKIYAYNGNNRDKLFYAIPMTTKNIHVLGIKRANDVANIMAVHNTGHQMKKIILRYDKHNIITYAYDGLVILRPLGFKKKLATIMPHFRCDGGVSKAYIDPPAQHILSLGKDNTLVCTVLENIPIDEERQELLKTLIESPKLSLLFKRPTIGFTPTGDLEGKTWLEVAKVKKEEQERAQCEKERNSILKEFKEIQSEIQELLTKNLEGPENERIDIQEFNLDTKLKEEEITRNKEECKRTQQYLEAVIVAQDKVTEWLTDYCWKSMDVRGQVICGIFENFDVENYKLLPLSSTDYKNQIEAYRFMETKMSEKDSFQPWIPQTANELQNKLLTKPKLAKEVEIVDLLEVLEEEENQDKPEEEEIDLDTQIALKGSVTFTIVELNPGHYSQQEITSFLQSHYENYLNMNEIYKVKCVFNKQFQEMMTLKTREMSLIYERNARLRHILSELNYFSTNKFNIEIEDPPWSPREDTNSVMKINEQEIGILPYISPSEQAILDATAAEEERIRLLLLADDFRERALMAMMNGVLEIRWEDELRKDVPKPKCMLEKEPEEFNEEDLRNVRDYEEAVKFLNSERERYKKLLTTEYGKLSNYVREGIKKFNNKLSDFLLGKIHSDSSIRQENLRIGRMRLINAKRNELNKREKEIINSINANDKETNTLNGVVNTLQSVVQELRNNFEILTAKEKTLEKAFKKDFNEASPVVQEQSLKLYKRRPKTNVRNITSITLILEVAKCTMSHEKTKILTSDCLEYLKSLDTLDLYVNVPPAIDEHTYGIVVKHRRLKIESELRVRAVTFEIAEAEHTLQTFQKLLVQKRETNQKLQDSLNQIRIDRLDFFRDKEIQMVLRKGIVEVPTTGHISDYSNAVLISRVDVETINKIILRGGNYKIKAMKETMNFRRGILIKEWEHKRLRMKISDLEHYLHNIDSVKVTKEIQSYLKFKKRGLAPDKGLSFEEELELVKGSYHRIINDKKLQVKELQQKITALKKDNNILDKQIQSVNVDVCEYQHERNIEIDNREKSVIQNRMATLLKRSKLIKQIQQNHSDILMLQTELELLRLKTYPTLSYTILT